MSAARWLLAGVAAAGLAGCTAPSGYVGRFATEPGGPVGSIETRNAAPLVGVPAAAGPVLAVQQVRYPNGVSQDIILGGTRATAGENRIEVRMLLGPVSGRQTGGDQLSVPIPASDAIEDDLARLFPGVAMHISSGVVAAPGGDFSVASGRVGSTTCVYAWQYSAAARPLTLFEGAAGVGNGPMSVRMRLCRTLPLSAMLDIVRQLATGPGSSVGSVVGGGPYASALDTELDQSADQAEPAPRHRAPRRRARATKRSERSSAIRPERAMPVSGPRIPLPADVTSGETAERRIVAPTASQPIPDLPMPR